MILDDFKRLADYFSIHIWVRNKSIQLLTLNSLASATARPNPTPSDQSDLSVLSQPKHLNPRQKSESPIIRAHSCPFVVPKQTLEPKICFWVDFALILWATNAYYQYDLWHLCFHPKIWRFEPWDFRLRFCRFSPHAACLSDKESSTKRLWY